MIKKISLNFLKDPTISTLNSALFTVLIADAIMSPKIDFVAGLFDTPFVLFLSQLAILLNV